MDVLRVHVAVLENQIALNRLDAGTFEIGGPLLLHGGRVAVVKASADRRIAAADDLHVAVQRARRVDVAAHVDRGRDFE